jgi:hypothetical protein
MLISHVVEPTARRCAECSKKRFVFLATNGHAYCEWCKRGLVVKELAVEAHHSRVLSTLNPEGSDAR